MFKEFGKKLAVTLNVLLGIQLALLGLGSNATAARATSSMKLSTTLDATQLVAGVESEFSINLNNVGGNDYSSVFASFEIKNIEKDDIALKYFEVTTGEWLELPTVQSDTDLVGMFGPEEGIKVDNSYDATSKFKVLVTEPASYEISFLATDAETKNFVLLTENIVVAENAKLSTTLPEVLKDNRLDASGKSFPYEYEVTLDNTFGKDRTNLLGNFEIDNISLENLETLDYWEEMQEVPGWKSLKPSLLPNATGTGLVGTFGPNTGFPTPPNAYNPLTTATSKFRVNVKNTTIGSVQSYPVSFSLTDLNDPSYLLKVEKSIVSDGKAPEVKMTIVPAAVNDASKYTEVTFSADEAFELKSQDVIFEQVESFPVLLKAITVGNDIKVMIPEGSFKAQGDIKVSATFVDAVGNEKAFSDVITTDVKVPEKVTELSAVVNEDGHVLLTWKNPVLAEDYKEIRIFRNSESSPLAVLPLSATSYLDTTVEKGQAYYYDIQIIDQAGNLSEVSQATVTTPAPVVAAVASDTFVVTPPVQEEKVTEQEVKAETTENKVEENKKEDNLPLWGLIVLLVLAGLGGYLYFSKDEKKESKPVAQTVAKTSSKKKTTAKKKSKK